MDITTRRNDFHPYLIRGPYHVLCAGTTCSKDHVYLFYVRLQIRAVGNTDRIALLTCV